MTDAPEQIWAGISAARDGWYQNVNMKCGMYEFDMTEYTRTDIANARIAELEAALTECQKEIDDYIRQEYPGKGYLHERYRQRDFAANPARIALGTPNPTTGAK
jgi:hypothetical protein